MTLNELSFQGLICPLVCSSRLGKSYVQHFVFCFAHHFTSVL